jgi:hypothetical protein
MRVSLAILILAAAPALAIAQQKPALPARTPSLETDPRQEQIQAATTNAMTTLRDQVLRTRLSRDLLVGDFLERTNSLGELDRVLKAAQPIGGARWVDERTCQVRLELPESQVAALLMGIAHSPNQHSPIRPDVLKARFSDWSKLRFSVVGSSAGGDAIELARPGNATGKWSEVGDAARRSAIADARGDAAAKFVTAIGPVQLNDKTRASDALARPAIAAQFNSFLAKQPVTNIEFLDDLKVSVTISTAPAEMAEALQAAVTSDVDFSRPLNIDWQRVSRDVEQLPASAQGKASAVVSLQATSLPSTVLPLQPPDWLDQQLEAESSAAGGGAGSRLKVGRAAEADAVGKIREQFLLLHINTTATLGEAAHNDPELKLAVDRAMLQAHASRVDYLPDGSVKVRVTLDLRDAWDALRSNP